VAVTTPPGKSETEHDRDLAQRVADLEALIEEARRRARRRRMRNGAALAVAAAAAVVGLIGFDGGGGSGTGAAAPAGDSGAKSQATKPAPSLARLPYGNEAMAFAFDPRRPNVVYVASPDARGGIYVYKTTDSGRHWRTTAARGTGWMSDIVTLTADPQHPGTLYAGTDSAVYKTVDGGRSWRPLRQGLFPAKPLVCDGTTSPSPPSCMPFPTGTPGTTDWNRNNGWVLDVAVDPIRSNVVYSAAGAVRKSTDGGHTWKAVFVPRQLNTHRAIPLDFTVTRIAIAATRPESIYAIAHYNPDGETAIYKSTNGGTTWQMTGGSSRLPPSCCGDSQDALAVDPGNPQALYAAVGDTVFATTNGGASWQPAANGIPANDVTSLAVDPERSGTVYATVEQNLNHAHPTNGVTKTTGAIYKTTDAGQTWTEVWSGSGVDKVAVDPKRPSTLYASGWVGGRYRSHVSRCGTHPACFWHYQLLRSLDGGHTWTIGR
jgi:photosystem II stability/assembly factor-like uncharacterized protein